jgi:hypothetical protein
MNILHSFFAPFVDPEVHFPNVRVLGLSWLKDVPSDPYSFELQHPVARAFSKLLIASLTVTENMTIARGILAMSRLPNPYSPGINHVRSIYFNYLVCYY